MVQPTAARMMQATRAQFFRPGAAQRLGYVMRENRVPFYQRLHQNHDGKRQWRKTDRSPFLLYPFYAMMFGSLSLSTYGMIRMVFGKKTFI